MALLDTLPAAQRARIQAIAAASREQGVPAYLVGGFVRDLLLGRENRDLDVVVEGDGIELAARLAAALGGQVRAHPAFLTAVMVDPGGDDIDVATARSERYRAPAALPEVRAAALRGRPLPARLHGQHPGDPPGPGARLRADRSLRRPPRPRGEIAAGAARPLVHRRSHPHPARRAAGAAARLPDLPRDPGAGRGRRSPKGLSITSRARACGPS